MADSSIPGQRGVFRPPIQIARMENTTLHINRESGATEYATQYYLQCIVVEVAKDHIAYWQVQFSGKSLDFLPVLLANEISGSRTQELTDIGAQAEVGLVCTEQLSRFAPLGRR